MGDKVYMNGIRNPQHALETLRTGKLHGTMDDVYRAIEYVIGDSGIMTHHIPVALELLRPHVQAHGLTPLDAAQKARFWADFKTKHAAWMSGRATLAQ